ncbi:MAG TPA: extensin family protein [Allosphingosinicella sp.]
MLAYARRHPEDVPWTKLDLTRPVGAFTGRKLAALEREPGLCRALLVEAGVVHAVLPPHENGPNCSYSDAVRLAAAGSRTTVLRSDAGMSCPVAAALTLWEWHVVQPAARRHFGRPVTQVEHLGTYSCRRINGREDGDWSEHATANAIDIAAFQLEGGRRVSVLADWERDPAAAAFLREVRDGACRLFATVLSPDHNEAHRDHLHLDQGRGPGGWRACR